MTMVYEKPVLALLGSTLSLVLGSRTEGSDDSYPESNQQKNKSSEIEGLDD